MKKKLPFLSGSILMLLTSSFLSISIPSFSSEDEFDFGVEEVENQKSNINQNSSFNFDLNGNILFKATRLIGANKRWIDLGPSLKLKGSINSNYGLFKFDGDSQFNMAFKVEGDDASFSKKNLPKNSLRELYFQKSFGKSTIHIGKKIVVWGKADALVVTDVLTPKDYSLFQFSDIEKSRMGQLLFEWDLYLENIEFNLYAIPYPLYNRYPDQGHPFGLPTSYHIKNHGDFSKKNQKPEWALRLNYESDWGSMALLLASIQNREALLETLDLNNLLFQEKHERYTFLGLTMDIALKKILLKMEIGYEKEKPTQSSFNYLGFSAPTIIKKETLSLMGGIDYNHNKWGHWILEVSSTKVQNLTHLLLISWNKSYLNDNFNISTGLNFYNHIKNLSFNINGAYKINDFWEISLNCNFIDIQSPIEENPMLSQLGEMDQMGLKVKYLF